MTPEKWDVLVRAAEAGYFEDDYDAWNVARSGSPEESCAYASVKEKAEALVGCDVPLETLLMIHLEGDAHRLVNAIDERRFGPWG